MTPRAPTPLVMPANAGIHALTRATEKSELAHVGRKSEASSDTFPAPPHFPLWHSALHSSLRAKRSNPETRKAFDSLYFPQKSKHLLLPELHSETPL